MEKKTVKKSFSITLDDYPGYVFRKSVEGIYLGCNTSAARLAGLSSCKHIVGKSDLDMPWHEQAKAILDSDKEVITTGEEKTVEEARMLAEGRIARFLTCKKPIKENKITVEILSISLEVPYQVVEQNTTMFSNHGSPELAAVYLKNILLNLPEPIYWMNKEGIIQGCNEAEAKLFGFKSPKEMIGKSIYDIAKMLGWDKAVANKLHQHDLKVMQTGKQISTEEIDQSPSKELRTFISHKAPLYDDNDQIIGLIGTSIDITERKKMEEELIQAKKATEAANYLMTEFISNMGHDLATPISDVGSVAQMLNFYADTYPELKELFDDLILRAEACEKVRKTILNATSISNLDVKLETFSTIQVLLELEKELRPTIGSKNLKLIIHPLKQKKEDLIETDRIKFRKILCDLISNAINFTEEGQVTISVLKEGELFHIKVSDTGIGIPTDKFDYIFQQYTKLSRSNKHGATFKGVGAGLYLTKIRANILNATISVESEVDKGSIFTLSIPAHFVKSR